MKTFLRYAFFLMLVPALFLTSCKDDADEELQIDTYQVLVDHLTDIDMDLNHVIKNAADQKFVTGASEALISSKYIIDIRSAEVFGAGHISGAHNVTFANILNAAADADKPILVVCYSGQTACYATALLRLYGHHDAQALKWGMCGWSATTAASWNGNIGDIAVGDDNWSYDSAPEATIQDAPTFNSAYTTGADILKDRVEAVVAAGFKKVKGVDVLATPTNYFINNYFSDAHYTGFGHINGAYRIFDSFLMENGINKLDPSKHIVTYCYTGQTSAVITAFLNVLGYNASSLLFGMNGLYNSNPTWSSNQWGQDSNPKDLPLVQ